MVDQLELYNGALELLGERELQALTDNDESRYVLDGIWNRDVVKECLEAANWTFATRSIQLDATDDFEPDFGYQYAFNKPDDFVRLVSICSDEYYNSPMTNYFDENNYYYCDLDRIYIRYISDDSEYGRDYSLWQDSFTDYVKTKMARRAAPRLLQNRSDLQEIKKELDQALSDAIGKDVQNRPTVFLPQGAWVRARLGRTGRYKDIKRRRDA